MLFLKFNVFLLHVSFFLIKETYGFLLNINLRRHFTFSFLLAGVLSFLYVAKLHFLPVPLPAFLPLEHTWL
jgi:hypothetical protein